MKTIFKFKYLLAEQIGINPKTNKRIFKDFYVCTATDIVEAVGKYDRHYHKPIFSGFCLYDEMPISFPEGELKLNKDEVEIENIDIFIDSIVGGFDI